MSILLVYKTKTGFTKKYVDWITEIITCDTVLFNQINKVDINNYDIIIYGAGIFAGRVKGLKKFKKKVFKLVDKKIIVFATGAAPYHEKIISNLKKDNFTENELDNLNFFYFQSGMNYEKIGLFSKMIMKIYRLILKNKKDKSEIEDGTSNAILSSYDDSNSENIRPMIDYLKEIS